jgi:hypothetical protein
MNSLAKIDYADKKFRECERSYKHVCGPRWVPVVKGGKLIPVFSLRARLLTGGSAA